MFHLFQKKAKFEKVSWEQFKQDCLNMLASNVSEDDLDKLLPQLRCAWENIILPKRQTDGAAGYDFYLPFGATISDKSITIPTGIRVKMPKNQFLMLVPRSGLGCKYGMRFENTVGIVDSDYYEAQNEGHIMAKVSASTMLTLNCGERFMQGVILERKTAVERKEKRKARTGGFGSTGLGGETCHTTTSNITSVQ